MNQLSYLSRLSQIFKKYYIYHFFHSAINHTSIMAQKHQKDASLQEKRILRATALASTPVSIIARYLCHPIDTIKSKIQINTIKMRSLSDINTGKVKQLIKSTWQTQGIKGFYRGVSIVAFGSIFAFSCYMSAYEKSKQVLTKYPFFSKYPSLAHLISGFMAEACSCILWLPIDIIKERMQVQSEVKIYKYDGPHDAMKKIHKSQGIIGLYRAFGATLMFFGPFSALTFMFYEKLKKWIVKVSDKPTMAQSIICSAGASAAAGYLTTPLEMVKLRMQIQRADVGQTGGKLQNSIFGYKNIFHGLYLAYKNEGFLSLYKGAFLRVCFVVPLTTISFSLTEQLKQVILQRPQLDYFI